MRVKALLLAALLCLITAIVEAQSLPSAKPGQLGLSSERLQRITERLKADVEKGTIPGAVVPIARHGKVAFFETVGVFDPLTKAPLTKDPIFRIYSMSKPITPVAVMALSEGGKFNLSEPVSKYIPQLGGLKVGVETPDPNGGKPTLELVTTKRDMTIQDLFRHTSGLTYGFFGNTQVKKMYVEGKVWNDYPSNAELVDRLAKLPLAYRPGTTWDYRHSTDVLGRLVEVISRQSLYQFEKERLLDPLGMKDANFYVTDKSKQGRLADAFSSDRTFGIDADFSGPRMEQKWESDGGGTVSTAMDYARFLQMLRNSGTLDGKRILSPKTIAYMTADHLGTSIEPSPLYRPERGRRHLLLGRPEGGHVRRLHDAIAQAARALSLPAQGHGLHGVEQAGQVGLPITLDAVRGLAVRLGGSGFAQRLAACAALRRHPFGSISEV